MPVSPSANQAQQALTGAQIRGSEVHVRQQPSPQVAHTQTMGSENSSTELGGVAPQTQPEVQPGEDEPALEQDKSETKKGPGVIITARRFLSAATRNALNGLGALSNLLRGNNAAGNADSDSSDAAKSFENRARRDSLDTQSPGSMPLVSGPGPTSQNRISPSDQGLKKYSPTDAPIKQPAVARAPLAASSPQGMLPLIQSPTARYIAAGAVVAALIVGALFFPKLALSASMLPVIATLWIANSDGLQDPPPSESQALESSAAQLGLPIEIEDLSSWGAPVFLEAEKAAAAIREARASQPPFEWVEVRMDDEGRFFGIDPGVPPETDTRHDVWRAYLRLDPEQGLVFDDANDSHLKTGPIQTGLLEAMDLLADQIQRIQDAYNGMDRVEEMLRADNNKLEYSDADSLALQTMARWIRLSGLSERTTGKDGFYGNSGTGGVSQGIKLRVGDIAPGDVEPKPDRLARRMRVLWTFLNGARRWREGGSGREVRFKASILMDELNQEHDQLGDAQNGKFITVYVDDPAEGMDLMASLDQSYSREGVVNGMRPPREFPWGDSEMLSWRAGLNSGESLTIDDGDGNPISIYDNLDPVENIIFLGGQPGMGPWLELARQSGHWSRESEERTERWRWTPKKDDRPRRRHYTIDERYTNASRPPDVIAQGGHALVYTGIIGLNAPILPGLGFSRGESVAVKTPLGDQMSARLNDRLQRWQAKIMFDAAAPGVDPEGRLLRGYLDDRGNIISKKMPGYISLQELLAGSGSDPDHPETWDYPYKALLTRANFDKIEAGILAGLKVMHDKLGLVHSDIKPANILVNIESGNFEVVLLDFGITAPIGGYPAPIAESEQRSGTPEYAPGRQVSGNEPASPGDDFFAFRNVQRDLKEALEFSQGKPSTRTKNLY